MEKIVPDLKENVFIFSPLSTTLAVGLSYMAFIMLRYDPSIPTLLTILFPVLLDAGSC